MGDIKFDSILSLGFGSILLPVLGQSMSRGVPNGRRKRQYFFYYRDKCALFHYFAFLNRLVSLKEREFLHTQNFTKLITVQPIQIHRMGGSSNPEVGFGKHALFLSIESIFQRIGWYFGKKLLFHCIGAR
jgi:hypothetical protein